MRITTKLPFVTMLAVSAIALPGCAVFDDHIQPVIAEPAAVATPSPILTEAKPTVESIAVLKNGANLTDTEAKFLARSTGTGLKAYIMPNGDKVLVKKLAKLPKKVLRAEKDKLAAIDMPTKSSEQMKTIENLMNAAQTASFSTGKRACVVLHAEYGNVSGPGTSLQWVAAGCPVPEGNLIPHGWKKNAVIETARARIATADDPREWVLIIED